jgi:hypothetical protein
LNDSGAGSLRQAILDANAAAGADVIEFQTGIAGTINPTSALPDLSTEITVNAPGCGKNKKASFNLERSLFIFK